MKRLGALFAALLVALLLLVWRSRLELESARPHASASPAEPAAEEAPLAPAQAQDALLVRGVVLEGSSQVPIAGAEVRLSGEPGQERAATDRTGRFALELDPLRWTLGETVDVRVGLAGGGKTVLEGRVVLAPELVLRGARRTVLRGRLVAETALGFGEPDGPPILLAVSAPGALDGGGAFGGTTWLNRAKRFELEAWLPEVPPELQLDFGTGTARLLSVKARTSVLTSPEGATIRLPLARFHVHVVDGRGQPLAEAEVWAKPLPLEREAALLRGTSDASGLVHFQVPPGEVELAVGLAGHAAHVGMAEAQFGSDPTERVVLSPLAPSERLFGAVVDADGAPVAGARVSAMPRTIAHELAAVASFGQESDADGRFDFAVGANVELEVRARREDLGSSRALLVPPGARELRLVIEPRGTLRLRLQGLPPGAGTGLGFEWRVVDAQGRVLDSGRARTRALELEPLPCGTLDVHARALGADRFGSARVQLEPGVKELALDLRPARRVHGVLLERDGTPAAGRGLYLEGPWLAPRAAEPFALGHTDGLGGFDLLLSARGEGEGEASEGVLCVEREGGEPLRFPVEAGRTLELRLP